MHLATFYSFIYAQPLLLYLQYISFLADILGQQMKYIAKQYYFLQLAIVDAICKGRWYQVLEFYFVFEKYIADIISSFINSYQDTLLYQYDNCFNNLP